jgi:hypothetical protein
VLEPIADIIQDQAPPPAVTDTSYSSGPHTDTIIATVVSTSSPRRISHSIYTNLYQTGTRTDRGDPFTVTETGTYLVFGDGPSATSSFIAEMPGSTTTKVFPPGSSASDVFSGMATTLKTFPIGFSVTPAGVDPSGRPFTVHVEPSGGSSLVPIPVNTTKVVALSLDGSSTTMTLGTGGVKPSSSKSSSSSQKSPDHSIGPIIGSTLTGGITKTLTYSINVHLTTTTVSMDSGAFPNAGSDPSAHSFTLLHNTFTHESAATNTLIPETSITQHPTPSVTPAQFLSSSEESAKPTENSMDSKTSTSVHHWSYSRSLQGTGMGSRPFPAPVGTGIAASETPCATHGAKPKTPLAPLLEMVNSHGNQTISMTFFIVHQATNNVTEGTYVEGPNGYEIDCVDLPYHPIGAAKPTDGPVRGPGPVEYSASSVVRSAASSTAPMAYGAPVATPDTTKAYSVVHSAASSTDPMGYGMPVATPDTTKASSADFPTAALPMPGISESTSVSAVPSGEASKLDSEVPDWRTVTMTNPFTNHTMSGYSAYSTGGVRPSPIFGGSEPGHSVMASVTSTDMVDDHSTYTSSAIPDGSMPTNHAGTPSSMLPSVLTGGPIIPIHPTLSSSFSVDFTTTEEFSLFGTGGYELSFVASSTSTSLGAPAIHTM